MIQISQYLRQREPGDEDGLSEGSLNENRGGGGESYRKVKKSEKCYANLKKMIVSHRQDNVNSNIIGNSLPGWDWPTEEGSNRQWLIEEVSFEFRFKGINRARLSDVSWEVIPEEGGAIGKSLATVRSPELWEHNSQGI